MLRQVAFRKRDEEWLRARFLPEALPDKEEVLSYLQRGLVRLSLASRDVDRFAGFENLGPAKLLTDGAWFWPSAFVHYVERYDFAVPADFLEHIRSRRYLPPVRGSVALDLEIPDPDDDSSVI